MDGTGSGAPVATEPAHLRGAAADHARGAATARTERCNTRAGSRGNGRRAWSRHVNVPLSGATGNPTRPLRSGATWPYCAALPKQVYPGTSTLVVTVTIGSPSAGAAGILKGVATCL